MKEDFVTVTIDTTNKELVDVDVYRIQMISKPSMASGRSSGWFVLSDGEQWFVYDGHLALHTAWLKSRKTTTFAGEN